MSHDLGLSQWQSFFVIVGSSSAALIGLQFVVITLIANTRKQDATPGGIGAFATPTVVHFAGALLVAAVMSVPWQSLTAAGIALGVSGAAGVVYSVRVLVRALRQSTYQPVWEDWLWHFLLPGAAYLALAVGGALLPWDARAGSFIAAGAALALLFIGIHNAWDTVTYLVIGAAANEAPPNEST